ncbi:MAG: response regulator transcription factor, partial [Lachnospiraceae bacterium]|nr:response regulator transcription factor [Lachnospiraceae bacterium]
MINVMIADDQQLIRESLKIVLNTEEDISVSGVVGDGDEVLEALKRTAPDVILMDVRMPKMDGVA